MTSGRKE